MYCHLWFMWLRYFHSRQSFHSLSLSVYLSNSLSLSGFHDWHNSLNHMHSVLRLTEEDILSFQKSHLDSPTTARLKDSPSKWPCSMRLRRWGQASTFCIAEQQRGTRRRASLAYRETHQQGKKGGRGKGKEKWNIIRDGIRRLWSCLQIGNDADDSPREDPVLLG